MARGLFRWKDFVDTLLLTDQDFFELSELRRRGERTGRGRLRTPVEAEGPREYQRVRIQGTLWIPAEIREPSGSIHQIKVYPVDICSGGMCFFADRFMHQDTMCDLTFQLPDGEVVMVMATTVRCRYIRGRAHEVGVSFDTPFDMGVLNDEVPAKNISPAGAPGVLSEVPETLRRRLPTIVVELKKIVDRISEIDRQAVWREEVAGFSTQLAEIAQELRIGVPTA
jgi:hypothetical protein